jgi:hypothetical protein
MHLVKLTMTKYLLVLFVALGLQNTLVAQENSPYSRYGIGDLTPNHNIVTRGMGGIAAGFNDWRNINFTNPASLAALGLTTFEVGGDIDTRTLKSANPIGKFKSTNTLISYVALGFPVASTKMKKKGIGWGVTFGLRPVSRINYKIQRNSRLNNIDSIVTMYEGEGGANQFFIGTGLSYKKFSFGLNSGYMFGNKDYSTKLEFINDTVPYYRSNSATQTRFGGIFLNAGIQYEDTLNKVEARSGKFPNRLRIGAYVNLQQKLNATQDIIRETFVPSGNGDFFRLDSVYDQRDVAGKIVLPVTIGAGFTYTNRHWLIGADFEMTNWSNYRFYNAKDAVQNTWVIRGGAQYYPAKDNTPATKYFNFVRYRAGFYYGPDYVKLSKSRNEFGITAGAGFPLTSLRRVTYNNDFVTLNTAVEYGNRGNIKADNLKENIFRISIGVSMNSQWFFKRKYD